MENEQNSPYTRPVVKRVVIPKEKEEYLSKRPDLPARRPATKTVVSRRDADLPHPPTDKGPKKPGKPPKKKWSKGKKALVSVVCILLVLIIAVGGTGAYFLGKIDYDNGNNLQQAPSNPEGEDDDPDILQGLSDNEKGELSDANDDINKNLSNNQIWYSDSVKNILLMGIDYGSKGYPYGRSDSMIIVSINEATKKLKLISLSRAVYAAIDGYENTRLSHAHGYGGAALAIDTIQKNYKIRIDNYASVNFSAFSSIIDALGGVPIKLTSAEAKQLASKIGSSQPGTYNLNGAAALHYARLRKIDTDRDRTGRQRTVLEALANKAKSMSATQLISSMNTILPYVRTNMSQGQLISYATKAFEYLDYEREELVIPHKSTGLKLRGGFEVLLIDWEDEVKYLHDVMYSGVEAKTVNN